MIYKWTDVKDIVDSQHHLMACKNCDLLEILRKHEKPFDGTLGIHSQKKVHIHINSNDKPVNVQPYPTSVHLSSFNHELDHSACLDTLVPWQESEWASPSLITPQIIW